MKKVKMLILFLFTIFFLNPFIFQRIDHPSTLSEVKDPKISIQDITIITPENKTYSEPTSGYYPGTYGFEEADSTTSTNINFIDTDLSGSGIIPSIITGVGGHEKVLELNDNSGSATADIRSNINSTPVSGTIEWYWRSTNVNNIGRFDLRYDDSARIRVGMWNNYLNYFDGTNHNIVGITSNTWYHIRIDFESDTGGYQGLSADTYYLYLNGVQYGPYNFVSDVDYIDDIRISTHDTQTGYNNYIDALGYSWDPNYNIGDNLQEGLLVSFENSTALDWMGYSLDKQANRTILGNSTIPMPDYGIHNVQVFGNDTFGIYHQSDLVYFSYNLFRINSPENITYTSSMSGYYPATHGFENEVDGTSGTDIRFVDDLAGSEANTFVTVQAGEDGHNKVLELYDNNGAGNSVMRSDSLSATSSGTIEFYIKTSDSTKGYNMNFGGLSGGAFLISIDNSQFRWYDGGTYYNIIGCLDNTWYHIKIEFESTVGGYKGLTADTYYMWINNVRYGPYDFVVGGDEIDFIQTVTYTLDSAYNVYLDAIGYSWDPNYNIGDNLDEGLLLSFENDTVFGWIGYSLDGQVNKTILGNVTIPLPVNGIHTIQVFGDTLIDPILETELIIFTINTSSETVPPPPATPFDTTIVIITSIIIIIGVVGLSSFGFIYLKRVRQKGLKVKPKDTKKDEEKKMKAKLILERERLKRERIESERLENERLERERLIRQENLAREEERKTLEKLKKIMSVSSRISMEMVREYMKIDKLTFNEKVIDWASQFGFTIDGEYLNIRKENVSDFIDELEKQFSQWRKDEQGRESKI